MDGMVPRPIIRDETTLGWLQVLHLWWHPPAAAGPLGFLFWAWGLGLGSLGSPGSGLLGCRPE